MPQKTNNGLTGTALFYLFNETREKLLFIKYDGQPPRILSLPLSEHDVKSQTPIEKLKTMLQLDRYAQVQHLAPIGNVGLPYVLTKTAHTYFSFAACLPQDTIWKMQLPQGEAVWERVDEIQDLDIPISRLSEQAIIEQLFLEKAILYINHLQ